MYIECIIIALILLSIYYLSTHENMCVGQGCCTMALLKCSQLAPESYYRYNYT